MASPQDNTVLPTEILCDEQFAFRNLGWSPKGGEGGYMFR